MQKPGKKPANANKAPFSKELMPTNAGKLGRLGTMLSAIKHVGRPAGGSKPPFAK